MTAIEEYCLKYKDVEISGIDPAKHYNIIGKKLGRIKNKIDYFKKSFKYFFIGHDGSNTGAPHILLNIIKNLKDEEGKKSILLLKRGGELVTEYRKYITTVVLEEICTDFQKQDNREILKEIIEVLDIKKKPKFILNTADVLSFIDILHDFKKYVLIHETVNSVDLHFGGQKCIDILAYESNKIIFPTNGMREEFISRNKQIKEKSIVIPYGVNFKYKIDEISGVSKRVRDELGCDLGTKVILGCGSIEHRKGVDLFVDAAIKISNKATENGQKEPLFIWVGPEGDIEYSGKIYKRIKGVDIKNIVFTGSVSDVDKYHAASDLFILSSRMESLGMVALEALSYCSNLILFNDTSGVQTLLMDNEYESTAAFNVDQLADIAFEKLYKSSDKNNKEIAERIRNNFNVYDYAEKVFSIIEKKEVLIIGYGPPPIMGAKVEGGGLRNWGLATAISKQIPECNVTFSFKFSLGDTIPEGFHNGIKLLHWKDESIYEFIQKCDIIILSYCMGSDTERILSLTSKNQLIILDCYVPIHIEVSSREAKDLSLEAEGFKRDMKYWNQSLLSGDLFLCASNSQMEYYKGILSCLGKLNPMTYKNHGIRILPYGINSDLPVTVSTPYSAHIQNNTKVFKLLWFGGVYPWFDTNILLEAISKVQLKHKIHLAMVGAKNPFVNNTIFLEKNTELDQSIKRMKLTDVVSLHEWIPYERRADWYCDCEAIITLNKEGMENSLSWRTRLVDYVWSGMPVLTNGGDPLGEQLISAKSAGRVSIKTSDELAEDISYYISNPNVLLDMKKGIQSFKSKLLWDKIILNIKDDIIMH
jgi:glycosyltransferase involved in cell wall biosynthesis